jgi:hypothetical protein
VVKPPALSLPAALMILFEYQCVLAERVSAENLKFSFYINILKTPPYACPWPYPFSEAGLSRLNKVNDEQ